MGYEAMWDSTFSGWGVQGVRGTLNRQCDGACLNDPGMPGCRSRAAGPHRQYVLHRLCNKALLLPGEMMIQGPSLPRDCLELCQPVHCLENTGHMLTQLHHHFTHTPPIVEKLACMLCSGCTVMRYGVACCLLLLQRQRAPH